MGSYGSVEVDPKETANTNKFISSHMTLAQALSRGITQREWLAIFESNLKKSNLTESERAELELWRDYNLAISGN